VHEVEERADAGRVGGAEARLHARRRRRIRRRGDCGDSGGGGGGQIHALGAGRRVARQREALLFLVPQESIAAALEVPAPRPLAVRGVLVVRSAVLAAVFLFAAVGAAPCDGHHVAVATEGVLLAQGAQ